MHPELLNNPTFLRYHEIWQRDPKSLVFAPLADFFCQHKLYADARKVCEAGVKHNPNSVLAHYSLAKAYLCTREWHSARHEAQWVLARTSDHQGALDVLRQVEQHQVPVRHMMVQPEVATSQNDRLAEVMVAAGGSSSPVIPAMLPDSGKSQPVPAVLGGEEARNEESILDPRSKLELTAGMTTKKMPWQTVTMAKIYSQQGLYFKARTIYKTILSRDPQNVEAQAGLATLERTMRDAAA